MCVWWGCGGSKYVRTELDGVGQTRRMVHGRNEGNEFAAIVRHRNYYLKPPRKGGGEKFLRLSLKFNRTYRGRFYQLFTLFFALLMRADPMLMGGRLLR